MANTEFLVPVQGPGSTQLIRVALIETDQTGTFNLTFEGVAEPVTSTSVASSIVAAANKIAGVANFATISTNAATETLTATDSGRWTVCTRTSTTQVFTLPVAAAGLSYGFVTTSAASEVLLNPGNGTDVFQIKATIDAGASIVTAAGVGIKNTAATNVVGDLIEIIGTTGVWIMIRQSGIWASQ
jgi:hypothetical protein